MDQALQTKLERLKNCHTRYEIAAICGEKRLLIGYSARVGRSGILSMIRHNAEKFAQFFKVDSIQWNKRASDGATVGNWQINFSGRTQRDAYISGELPFFADSLRERAA